jgi:hypothetical protein
VPKSRAAGARVRVEGEAAPKREMKLSEEVESERISTASMRVPVVVGVKVMRRSQLAPGTTVAQLRVVTVKSGVVWMERMRSGTVPVLESVTVWGVEALPTAVASKVRELWEAV